MYFTDISYSWFVPTEKIKFVISNLETKTVSTLVKQAQESNKFIKTTTNKSTVTYIVLEDGTVLSSPIKAETIYKRVIANGHLLYSVDTDYFISVSHIKVISDYSGSLAVDLVNKPGITGSDLRFIRQRESKKTILLMTTGESVCLSKYTKDVITEIEKCVVSPNIAQVN